MGDRQAEGALPSFKQLFAESKSAVRKEAFSASAGIRSAADRLIVRRLLARTRRIEMTKRLMVDWQQDYWGLRRDALGAVKYLERLVKHLDPQPFPELRRALETLQFLALPLAERNKRGRRSMPHHRMALKQMTAMKIPPDEARAMLRGIGISIRRSDLGN